MPTFRVDFDEAFQNQRSLAATALESLHQLEAVLKKLLPGEEPETGELRDDIQEGLAHLAEIESLINDQWFRNRGRGKHGGRP
jgi:hypothetical protein